MMGAVGDFIGENYWGFLCLCIIGIFICIYNLADIKHKKALNAITIFVLFGVICYCLYNYRDLNNISSHQSDSQEQQGTQNEDIVIQLNLALQSLDFQAENLQSLLESYDNALHKIKTLSEDLRLANNNSEYITTKAAHLENKLKEAHEDYEEALRTLFLGNDDDLKSYYTKVYNMLQVKADKNSEEAKLLIAFMLDPSHEKMKIDGVIQDTNNAIRAYKRVENHPEAQYSIANLYYVMKDYENAAKWYLRAAYNGHVEAQYMLGYMHGKQQYYFNPHIDHQLYTDNVFQKNFREGINKATGK